MWSVHKVEISSDEMKILNSKLLRGIFSIFFIILACIFHKISCENMSVNRNKNALQKKISTHFGRLGRGQV